MATAVTLDIDPFDPAFLETPYAHHARLRDAGPVVWLEAIGAYGIARFADVQAALKDHRTFCSGRGVGLADFAKETPWRPPSLLLEADPPLHDRTRGTMNRIVSLAALKELRPVWQAKADALVDALVARRHFDAVTDLSEVFPMAVFPDTIGLPVEGREALLVYAAAVFNGFGPRNALLAEGEARAQPAMAWVAAACKRENLAPGGWGMAVYEAADRGEVTHDEAERLVRSFLSAGVDTTVNGLAHLILAFASTPGEWAKLRANPALTRKALDESLRWDSTVQTFFRTTTRETMVDGVPIPDGEKVVLFLASANRDPRRWERPEIFDIDRSASGHVGFGFGIHQCLGQMLARLEGEVVLNAMVERIADIRATGPATRRLNNTLRAIERLPVEVVPA
jgi:cytochrome P450